MQRAMEQTEQTLNTTRHCWVSNWMNKGARPILLLNQTLKMKHRVGMVPEFEIICIGVSEYRERVLKS